MSDQVVGLSILMWNKTLQAREKNQSDSQIIMKQSHKCEVR